MDSEQDSVSSNRKSSCDDEAVGATLPPGVLRPCGRGWAGEELEIDHRRQQVRAKSDQLDLLGVKNSGEPRVDGCSYTAVDLSKFRNTEVGRGYQAKHVIRQRSATCEEINVTVFSDPLASSSQSRIGRKRSRGGSNSEMVKKGDDRYLHLKAMRDFRRELEKYVG